MQFNKAATKCNKINFYSLQRNVFQLVLATVYDNTAATRVVMIAQSSQ